MSHVIYEWVISHINESYHKKKCVSMFIISRNASPCSFSHYVTDLCLKRLHSEFNVTPPTPPPQTHTRTDTHTAFAVIHQSFHVSFSLCLSPCMSLSMYVSLPVCLCKQRPISRDIQGKQRPISRDIQGERHTGRACTLSLSQHPVCLRMFVRLQMLLPGVMQCVSVALCLRVSVYLYFSVSPYMHKFLFVNAKYLLVSVCRCKLHRHFNA